MSQRGLSLIELIVVLAISSLLIAGIVTLYVRCSATYAVNETVARLQETARYALNTIEADIRLAGYWGLTNDARSMRGTARLAPIALPARAAGCGPQFPLELHRPLAGTNNTYSLPCAATGGAQSGADVLVVRRAEPATAPASRERLQIYTARGGESNALFLANTAPGALTTDATFGPVAEIHDLVVRAYYISRNSTAQAGVAALRRKILQGGPATGPDIGEEEIMPGIEDLQVQFGIDAGADIDADGEPDYYTGVAERYVNPNDPALDTALVITARIWVRARSESAEVGYVDNKTYDYADVSFRPTGAQAAYRRLLLTRTIQLRNTTGLRP